MNQILEMTAKVLANEDIRVSKSKVKTAYFDLKNRHLVLPEWEGLEPVVEDMLICHEVSHALFTPNGFMTEVKARPFMKSYLNVLEDARCEKLFKERYNGARKSFVQGYKNIRETDFFGLNGIPVNEMNLIDKINMFFKFGIASGVKFAPRETKFVERAAKLVTWEEVVALANEIYEFAKAEKEAREKELEEMKEQGLIEEKPETEEFEDEDFGDFGDEGEDFEDEDEDEDFGNTGSETDEDEDANESEKSEAGESTEDEADENEGESTDNNSPRKNEGNESGADSEADEANDAGDGHDPLDSQTERKMKDRLEDAANVSGEAAKYVELDEDYGTLPFLIRYKDVLKACLANVGAGDNYRRRNNKEAYDKFKKISLKQVNHLLQQFEMRKAADIYARRQVAKTGQIDVNKIAQYKIKDDLFKRNIKFPNGKNHGMVMLLDWSSSMYTHSNIRHSLDQVQLLVTFCRKSNIPYRVYAFASNYGGACKGNHHASQMDLIELFSDKMTLNEHNEMMMYSAGGTLMNTYSLSSTPLAPALLAMRKLIPMFKDESKAQKVSLITFTDGGNTVRINPHSWHNGSVFYRDKVTKKNYLIDSGSEGGYRRNYSDVSEINIFYQILKDRIEDLTIISFFIGTAGNLDEAVKYSGFYDNYAETSNRIKAQYVKDQFYKLVGQGRDAAYLVSTRMLHNKDMELGNITGDMTSNKIASILKKSGKESLKGKILLEKFIETIS